jgi:hypothetical protein
MTKRKIEYRVIPPESDAEFVANMEHVLETYENPYDSNCPVICMDEQPVQLVKETRQPIPATKTHARRVDYEYERAGTASIFMFTEPLSGWRQATARQRRTKVDWAQEMARHLEGRYANCEKIILICDNFNTHTKGAFYEVFEPAKARALTRRIEFCYTPKHGSWLNIAENELSSMTRQCLNDRRIGELETLQEVIDAWPQGRRRIQARYEKRAGLRPDALFITEELFKAGLLTGYGEPSDASGETRECCFDSGVFRRPGGTTLFDQSPASSGQGNRMKFRQM